MHYLKIRKTSAVGFNLHAQTESPRRSEGGNSGL